VRFHPGVTLSVDLRIEGEKPKLVSLRYRHVDQSEGYQTTTMEFDKHVYRKEIPAAYTNSPYPLQYYFQLRDSTTRVSFYPGFNDDPVNQPYFVIRQSI
jgi:hypothetical protein